MIAKLVVEEGDLKGTVLSLEGGDQWVIGRDPEECQFILQDPSTSRRHLLCYRTPEGIIIENLSETNPVEVNAEEVNQPRLLQEGDIVKVGNEFLHFYINQDSLMIEENKTNDDQEGIEKSMKKMELIGEEPLQQELPSDKESQREQSPGEEEGYSQPDAKHDSVFEESLEGEKPQIAEVNFGITETGRWLLKVIGGPNNGAEFYMQSPESYLIGTDPLTCDIVFHDTSVSRQHARITVSPDETLIIEDLNSRNGVVINGQLIKEKQILQPSIIVNLGTTAFVVYDREGEMQTIISPLLPSIVKVLQKEEAGSSASQEKEGISTSASAPATDTSAPKTASSMPSAALEAKEAQKMSRFIILVVLSALLLLVGVGTATLFKEQPVAMDSQEQVVDQLKQALTPFSAVQYSFNKGTGHLLLIGHVKTANEKTQLLYNLQGLKFIKFIDDSGIIIDEYVWSEINQILAKNPIWRGISVYSPSAGQFVITGYLDTRKQAEQLSDYLSVNFPYIDLLQQKIIVDEDIINQVNAALQENGIREIKVQMTNGELSLTGSVLSDKIPAVDKVIAMAKDIPGVRSVKNFVVSLAPESNIVNISDRYEVTGISHLGDSRYTVIINGKILSTGDTLDGMKITSIQPGVITLEEGGTRYRIDFSK